MIGYDVGAHLELDNVSTGPFGYVDAQHSKNLGNLLPADMLMDRSPEIGLLPSSSNIAEPDAALNAASELLAGRPGHLGTGGGQEVDVLSHSERPSFIPGNGNHLGPVQQVFTSYCRDGMGESVGNMLAAFFLPGYGGTLTDMPSRSGETTGSGYEDWIGNRAPASIGMALRESNLEIDGGFSLVNEGSSAVENGQGRFYVPDIPNLARGQFDVEYGFPHLPEAVERGEESESVLDAIGRMGRRANLETSYEPLAANIAGPRWNEFDEFAPTGIVGNSVTESGNGGSESEGLFQKALYEGIMRGYEDFIPDSKIPNGTVNETDTAVVGAAIAGLNHRFDQLTGAGAATTDRWETMMEGGTRDKSTLKLPEGAGRNVGEAARSLVDLSALSPIPKLPGDEGVIGLSGMWEMLRNAERFLPKQRVARRRSEEVAPGELGEGPEPGLAGLVGKLLARGNVNELYPEPLDMRDTRISPDAGRSVPSGHKNDPIYTVAINQATGTLMPTVATAGTSTRSPAMPGQRNPP